MRIINYDKNYAYNVPVYAGGADIGRNALMKCGATAGTDFGAAVQCTAGANATEVNFRILGRLKGNAQDTGLGLDYSVEGETLQAGTAFVKKEIEPISPWRVCRFEISQASADLITCTQAVNSTTMTVTSLEDNIDASFFYVVSGTGAGQTNYLTAAASGSCTLKAAFGTDLDTTSKFIKIPRRFHPWISLNTYGSKIQSTAAQGGTRCTILDIFIQKSGGGTLEQLNPTIHDDLTDLDNLTFLKFWADVILCSSVYPIA